jgi:tRNA A37 threonylcarbamoyladenosine dehydratase
MLIERARAAGTPLISVMGAGNKLDPTAFEVADISKTSVCPLAKVMRVELRKRGINHVKVLYSKEEPVNVGSRTPASIAFVPSVAGLIIAGEVIKDLIRL